MKKVILLDKDGELKTSLTGLLDLEKYELIHVNSLEAAEVKFKTLAADLVISVEHTDYDSFELAERVRKSAYQKNAEAPVILFHDECSLDKKKWMRDNNITYFSAPYTSQEVKNCCISFLEEDNEENDQDKFILRKDEYLIHEGDVDKTMYWVKKGELRITKKENGKEVELETIEANQLIGEISFIDNRPRSASVKAISNSMIIRIHSEKYDKVLDKQPRWLQLLIQTLCDRLRKANSKVLL